MADFQGDLLVLGASGRVGRLMRRFWGQAALAPKVLWGYRTPPGGGAGAGDVIWDLDHPLPRARVVLVLSGVTRGTPEALQANIDLADRLAEAICRSGAEAGFFASTMAVYGTTPPGGATEETAPQDPRPYGMAKLLAEEVFLARSRGRLQPLILRFGNVVGADLLGERLDAGLPITLDRFGDGAGPRRSYLGGRHLVRAVADLTRQVLDHPADLPEHLNLAGQAPVDMADLLRAAGIGFDWQPAPVGALAEAAMGCRRLMRWVPPLRSEETAEGLAQDWLEMRR